MADLALHHGTIRTMDPAQPLAEALLVRDGRIAAVGSDADVLAVAGSARRVDLGGRALIPGFNDAHVHTWKVGALMGVLLDLRSITSFEHLAAALRTRAAKLAPGAPLLGRGLDESRLREGRLPLRAELDAIAADRPVWLIRACGHIGVANGRALAASGIARSTSDPHGGVIDRDAHGEPTGVLRETAIQLAQRALFHPTAADYEQMIRLAQKAQLEHGITSATEPGVDPELLAVYRSMADRGELQVRSNVMALGADGAGSLPALPEMTASDFLRVDTVKFFMDGGLSGATAALSSAYRDGSRGVLRLDADALVELAGDAHRQGYRIAAHAIGDVAIEHALAAFERLRLEGPGQRHRLEHFGLPAPDHLARADRGRHPVVAQATFLHAMGPNFRRALPDAFEIPPYPLRAVLDAGIDLALSSDAPVVEDIDPLRGMCAAMLRRDREGVALHPEQAIDAHAALRACTLGGAIASGDQHDRGMLRAGCQADLVVLSADPLATAPEALPDLEVDLTIVGGEVWFEG